jgi:hypothetical protein
MFDNTFLAMRCSKLILFSICVLSLTNSSSQTRAPKNLDEAILYLQEKWAKNEIDTFKDKPEQYAVAELGFGAGMWIRNNWVYGNRNKALRKYFDSLGIHHPDDISAIILTSLHRTLNQKDIELDKQVQSCKSYWETVNDCQQEQKLEAVANYHKFKVGDSVTIYLPVDTTIGSRNAVMFECPTPEWTFDPQNDLLIRGRITKKYFINDPANVFFTVHITFMNRRDTPILMTKVKIGHNKDFSLKGLTMQ